MNKKYLKEKKVMTVWQKIIEPKLLLTSSI